MRSPCAGHPERDQVSISLHWTTLSRTLAMRASNRFPIQTRWLESPWRAELAPLSLTGFGAGAIGPRRPRAVFAIPRRPACYAQFATSVTGEGQLEPMPLVMILTGLINGVHSGHFGQFWPVFDEVCRRRRGLGKQSFPEPTRRVIGRLSRLSIHISHTYAYH